MENKRLFLSINIDDYNILSRITTFQSNFKLNGIKLVNSRPFHLTIHFLGNTDEKTEVELKSILNKLIFPSFNIKFKGCGVFSSIRNPRVVWIGIEEGLQNMIKINELLKEKLNKLNLPLDDRIYNPHLTIARIKRIDNEEKQQIIQSIKENKDIIIGEQYIKGIHLMQSILTPQGAKYNSLYYKEYI